MTELRAARCATGKRSGHFMEEGGITAWELWARGFRPCLPVLNDGVLGEWRAPP